MHLDRFCFRFFFCFVVVVSSTFHFDNFVGFILGSYFPIDLLFNILTERTKFVFFLLFTNQMEMVYACAFVCVQYVRISFLSINRFFHRLFI